MYRMGSFNYLRLMEGIMGGKDPVIEGRKKRKRKRKDDVAKELGGMNE